MRGLAARACSVRLSLFSMDSASEPRLALVYPELARRVRVVAGSLGFSIRITRGLATVAEQDALWKKGRNPDGSYIDPVHQTGVVTHAKGDESWHVLSCAVDYVPMIDGVPQWDREKPEIQAMYDKVVELAEAQGLTCGARWPHPDWPHIQLCGNFPQNKPDAYALYLWSEGKEKLWAELDKQLRVITT
jgi:D-alanyl-D-alanine carboxypeptidase